MINLLYSSLEHLVPDEKKQLIKSQCEALEALVWVIEADSEACITVLVTPEPLTPIQSQFINACIANKEFDEGANK